MCDACGGDVVEGPDAGRGVYVERAGGALTQREVALCPRCALSIGMTVLFRAAEEEEEG